MTEEQKERLILLLKKEQEKLDQMSLEHYIRGEKLNAAVILNQSEKVYHLINDIEDAQIDGTTDDANKQ